MFTKILDYFNKDYDKYVCIIENLKHTKLDLEFLGSKSIAFKILPSNILMVAGDFLEVKDYLLNCSYPKVTFTPDSEIADFIEKHKGFSKNPCKQYFYNRYNDSDNIRVKKLSPNTKNAKMISDNYTLNYSVEEVTSLLKDRFILGGYIGGNLVGFCGMHEERSVGLLEIFKDYRRKGYGSALLKSTVNYFLDNNYSAFSHVRCDNIASIKLHAEIGARECKDEVFWLF